MAKKRTVIPRRKPHDAEARAASVQGDLFQAAAEARRDLPPPPQSLRALGLAIKMEAGDVLETAPEGPMRIISATGEEKAVIDDDDDFKIRFSIHQYLQNTRAFTRDFCNGLISHLMAILETYAERSIQLSHSDFIGLLEDAAKATRERELVDIGTSMYPNVDAPEIRERQLRDTLHIRQLKLIRMDSVMHDILPAICANLRADANLQSWLREGLVTEQGYNVFKEELIERNHSIRAKIEDEAGSGLPEGHLNRVDPENRGRRVYRECQAVKDVKLNGHEPPNGFIKGAYENLADDAKNCRVFWHPHGERHFFPDRPAEGEEF